MSAAGSIGAVDARIVRRETHSPRSTAAVITAVVLVLVIAWVATESVLFLLGLRPLLVSPRTMLTAVTALPDAPVALQLGIAALAALIGVLLVCLAILPGRRARRRLAADNAIVVADDDMVASALARVAARTAGVAADAVSVSLGRRAATVRIVPVSGSRVDREAVRSAVVDAFGLAGPAHPIRVAVLVSPEGRVGS
jgi:hypothetical protein